MKMLCSLLIICTASLAFTQEADEFAQDKADIKAAVLEEVEAFMDCDYETWAKHWVQTPDPLFVVSMHLGYSEMSGWESFQKNFANHFKQEEYNWRIEKMNFDIKTNGTSAFLTFDDVSSMKSDTTNRDSTRTYAIMIKEDGVWKYMYTHQIRRTSYEPSLANAISSLNWVAWTLFNNLDKRDDALKIMKINEQFDPENVETHWYYGEMFSKMEQKQEAIDHYRKVLISYPDNETVKNRIKALEE